MMRVRRGIAAGVVMAVLLGVVTTVAVAWGLAAWAPVSTMGPRVSGAFERWDRAWYITRIPHFGVRIHWWMDLTANEPLRTPGALLQALTTPQPTPAELVTDARASLIETQQRGNTLYPISIDHRPPPWGFTTGPPPPPDVRMGADTAFGWPAPCLWYQAVAGFNQLTMSTVNDRLTTGILLSGAPESRASTFRALPLRPIWSGLALNTVFYSVVWGVALFAPVAVRRWWRGRRGLCVRCGYDLRGQAAPGCPECGAGRGESSSR